MSAAQAAARAEVLLELGRPKEALAVLGPALAQDPDEHRLHCLASRAHLARGDSTSALNSAKAAIAVEPEHEWGHRLASLALMRRRDPGAVHAAREAVRLSPHAWQTQHQLAMALASVGLNEGAMEPAREAIRLHPDGAEPHFALGYAAMRAGKRAVARSSFERVVQIQPDHSAALNNLALLKLKGGRILQASHQLSGSLAADPHSPIAQYNVHVVARKLLRRLHIVLVVLNLALTAVLPEDTVDVNGQSVPSGQPTPHWFTIATPAALVLFLGAALYVDRKLPRSLRGYLRRLPFRDGSIGGWLACLIAVFVLMIARTLPQSASLRSTLHTVTLGLLIAAILVARAGRTEMKQRLADARLREQAINRQ